jgi:hypothetical protein
MKSGRIKNWPKEERPRERLLAEGPEKLTDAELLAIILRVGQEAPSKKVCQGRMPRTLHAPYCRIFMVSADMIRREATTPNTQAPQLGQTTHSRKYPYTPQDYPPCSKRRTRRIVNSINWVASEVPKVKQENRIGCHVSQVVQAGLRVGPLAVPPFSRVPSGY